MVTVKIGYDSTTNLYAAWFPNPSREAVRQALQLEDRPTWYADFQGVKVDEELLKHPLTGRPARLETYYTLGTEPKSIKYLYGASILTGGVHEVTGEEYSADEVREIQKLEKLFLV